MYARAWEAAGPLVASLSMPPFHNDPLALAAVGHCHVAGRGVAADKSKAETFYRQVGTCFEAGMCDVLRMPVLEGERRRKDIGMHCNFMHFLCMVLV